MRPPDATEGGDQNLASTQTTHKEKRLAEILWKCLEMDFLPFEFSCCLHRFYLQTAPSLLHQLIPLYNTGPQPGATINYLSGERERREEISKDQM